MTQKTVLSKGQELAAILLTDDIYQSTKPRSDAWTKEEDTVLMVMILDQHYFGNVPIKWVCEAAAQLLEGRNKGRCETRWHQKLKPLFEAYKEKQKETPVATNNDDCLITTDDESSQQDPVVWTAETDKEMAEFILAVKKTGGKLNEALEIYAGRTGRSFDDCRMRWDETVKSQYKHWIEKELENFRSTHGPAVNQQSAEVVAVGQPLSTESVIRFIRNQGVEVEELRAQCSKVQEQGQELDELRQRVVQLEGELSEEKLTNRELQGKYDDLNDYTNTLETSYKSFVGKLQDVASNDEFFGKRPEPVSLKMDLNGNLERAA